MNKKLPQQKYGSFLFFWRKSDCQVSLLLVAKLRFATQMGVQTEFGHQPATSSTLSGAVVSQV
jgi:hypothetical protein